MSHNYILNTLLFSDRSLPSQLHAWNITIWAGVGFMIRSLWMRIFKWLKKKLAPIVDLGPLPGPPLYLTLNPRENPSEILENYLAKASNFTNSVLVVNAVNFDHIQKHRPLISYKTQLLELIQLKAQYGSLIRPMFCVDPRAGFGQELAAMVENYVVKKGFAGICMYPSLGFSPADPNLENVYECAVKLDLPVHINYSMEGYAKTSFSDPQYVVNVLEKRPKLKLCVEVTSPISGAIEIIKKYDNTFLQVNTYSEIKRIESEVKNLDQSGEQESNKWQERIVFGARPKRTGSRENPFLSVEKFLKGFPENGDENEYQKYIAINSERLIKMSPNLTKEIEGFFADRKPEGMEVTEITEAKGTIKKMSIDGPVLKKVKESKVVKKTPPK